MRVGRNVAWNVAEALVTSLVLFILYRTILHQLGVAAMGIWALVVSATAVGRVGDLGVTGGLARFVAMKQADATHASSVDQPEPDGAAMLYVETALAMNTALYVCLGTLIYWPAWWALGWATHGAATHAARELLIYAIAAFVLQAVSGVLISALIGAHRSDRKSMVMLGATALQCVVALALIGPLNLVGLALAQICQYLVMIIASWILLCRILDGRWGGALPYRFDRVVLKELFGFGLRMQALSLSTILYEPAVKFVLSTTLGVSVLGLYELASRATLQLRALILAPSQNLTPLMTAEIHRHGLGVGINALYRKAERLMVTIGTVAMVGLAVGSPILSLIWFGKIDWMFVTISALICGGWMVNIWAVPAYYLGIASGELRWNIIGGLFTMTFSPIVAWLLSCNFGAVGSVIGVMIGVAGGAAITAVANRTMVKRRYDRPEATSVPDVHAT
ncbi:lipopolysaccharide biosynthesis protein [Brevundimonas sp.]|uniref:lipopolysaccharide biosynthesis protein n=1 Tax=Brevundimonas sp. TaxID=1871086 RepID=UPI003BAAF6B4